MIPFRRVLAPQPILRTSPGVFRWTRIATAIWALLYALLSIDPAIRDKIGAARDQAALTQTSPAPINRDSPQQHRIER